MYIRDIRKELTPLEVPGEKIWEIFRDKNTAGAIAEIEESKLHYHKYTIEKYLILEGEGEVHLDNKIVRVGPYSFLQIRPGIKHKARKVGDAPLYLYVQTSPPWSQEDHHLLE